MNTYKRIFNRDKYIVMILSGIIVSGVGLVSMIVMAGIWYL